MGKSEKYPKRDVFYIFKHWIVTNWQTIVDLANILHNRNFCCKKNFVCKFLARTFCTRSRYSNRAVISKYIYTKIFDMKCFQITVHGDANTWLRNCHTVGMVHLRQFGKLFFNCHTANTIFKRTLWKYL